MTLGEKLKEARKQAGLTQEQLAEKIGISRSAIAKWETDKGIPDIQNLKIISQLLDVSIDFLVDEASDLNQSVIKEPINLADYEGKGRKSKKDKIIREKYPTAEISPLIATKKQTRAAKIIDWALMLFTDAGAGTPDVIDAANNMDKQYYIVNNANKQFLVLVTDEFITSTEMAKKQSGKKFEVGNLAFTVVKQKNL